MRSLTKYACAVMAVTAGLAIAASPAAANHPKDTCPYHNLCEYQDAGFAGSFVGWHWGNNDYNYNDGGGTHLADFYWYPDPTRQINDDISALWNNTGRWVTLSTDHSIGGKTLCLAPDMAVRDLSNVIYQKAGILGGAKSFNDKLSAHEYEYTFGVPGNCQHPINRPSQRGSQM